jgi:integrase
MSCRFSRIARRRSEPGRPVRPPAAKEWPHTGLFFVKPDGQPWHPELVSERFERLVTDAGLPPIRLHDLRHCAATYLKAAGADMKDIQETLGHSSMAITADTYTSVIHELETERAKADAAVARGVGTAAPGKGSTAWGPAAADPIWSRGMRHATRR